jgi:hypothetical protein
MVSSFRLFFFFSLKCASKTADTLIIRGVGKCKPAYWLTAVAVGKGGYGAGKRV